MTTLYSAYIADNETTPSIQSTSVRQVMRSAARKLAQLAASPDDEIVVRAQHDDGLSRLYARRKVRDRYWQYN